MNLHIKTTLVSILLLFSILTVNGQKKVNKFYRLKYEGEKIPIKLRGNLSQKKILLFITGGPGEHAIDFALSDYPHWKRSLEKEVAIAYYDQRGLGRPVRKIDSTQITLAQYSRDINTMVDFLSETYQAEVYLLAHSYGGYYAYDYLKRYPNHPKVRGAIMMNTPITHDMNPLRWKKYRPMYLKNLADGFIKQGKEVKKWKEALDWITKVGAISERDDMIGWNRWVESAFSPAERKIKFFEGVKVLFGRPYSPWKYLNFRDNDKVGGLLRKEVYSRDFFTILPGIQKPVLLITGRYDDVAPPEEIEEASRLIEGSSYFIVPQAGHEIYLDQPALLNKAILGFLEK